MKQAIWTLLSISPIAKNTYRMEFSGDTTAFLRSGQFVNLSLPGFYLRRPFSLCDWSDNCATVIFKVLGRGTERMATLQPGVQLDALCGLGNGFDLEKSGESPLLVGGGAGVPPLYRLCRDLLDEGRQVRVALGFGSSDEVFLEDAFRALGAEVSVATLDGSCGIRGTALDACDFPQASRFYACGPTAMLKALCQTVSVPGEVSMEERMGCGFGACMGCTVMTQAGPMRACREGPVFDKEALAW